MSRVTVVAYWPWGRAGWIRNSLDWPYASQSLCNRHHLGERRRAQLFHDAVPVRLDRTLGRVQVVGNLLVALAEDDEIENLDFARREVRHFGLKRLNLIVSGAPALVLRERALDHLQQGFRRDGFLQKIVGAGLHRLDAGGDRALARQKDDGQQRHRLREPFLQFRAAQSGHTQIKQDASGFAFRQPRQEILARLVTVGMIARNFNDTTERRSERCVVVYDVDQRFHGDQAGSARGRMKRNTAPPPARLSAQIFPP